jgi:hypothetical protein
MAGRVRLGDDALEGRAGCRVGDTRAQAGPVSKRREREPEPKEPADKGALAILPIQLQVGDRYSDETGEWEVVSRPVSFRGGKAVRARVQVPGQPASERFACFSMCVKSGVERL